MSEEYKSIKKVVELELKGDADIKNVELDGIPYYDEEEYSDPQNWWDDQLDKDYDFFIYGEVDLKLYKNGELLYDWDNHDKVEFEIEGSWSWSHSYRGGYDVSIRIYKNWESEYDIFSEDEIKELIKDCLLKKNSEIASMALDDIGNPPGGDNFSELTFEWISHIE